MKNKKITEISMWEKKYNWYEILILFGTILFYAFIIIIPFWVIIVASFSSPKLVDEFGISLLPRGFSLEAYKMIFLFPEEMLTSYGLSILITLLGVVVNIVCCTTIAYALSKPYFNGNRIITLFLMFTVLFNAGYIPEYIIFRNYYKIFDTIWVLVFKPAVAFGEIIFLKVFYSSLPNDLFESAELDGANEFVCFFRIGTPLIIPGLSTFLFRVVLTYWNDPMTSMLYTDNYVPVALYLTRVTQYLEFIKSQIEGGFASNLPVDAENLPSSTMIYAMAIATSAPMLFIFTYFQKYFVRGITAGAVKG